MSKEEKEKVVQVQVGRPPTWKVWMIACRPHTLTASLAPVIVGYNASIVMFQKYYNNNNNNNDTNNDNNTIIDNPNFDRSQFFWLMIQWMIFCMMMQLGTNLHNDYSDFIKGADTDKRLGQARATQKGWLTPKQTVMGACFVLFIGLLLGIGFIRNIYMATTTNTTTETTTYYHYHYWRTLWMMLIVTSSIFNAFAYTGGWPLNYIGMQHFSIGYSGLGDLFVFIYFGLVATLTLPFLYITTTSTNTSNDNNIIDDTFLLTMLWKMFPYSIQVATLGVNIIVVNNLRDRFTDIHANKRTLAVRFGDVFCRIEYAMNIIIAYGLVLYDYYNHYNNDNNHHHIWRLLPLLSLPVTLKQLQAIHEKDGAALNPHVGGSAKAQFMFCILLAIGLRMS